MPSVGEDKGKWELWYTACKMASRVWKTGQQLLTKLNLHLSSLTHMTKRSQSICPQKKCTEMFIAALFTNKKW